MMGLATDLVTAWLFFCHSSRLANAVSISWTFSGWWRTQWAWGTSRL